MIFAVMLFHNGGYSQGRTVTVKDSAISLAPVIVYNKYKKKIITFEPDGHPAYNGLQKIKKFVCLLDTLPAGRIKSVSFYFNTGLINLLQKKLNINYKDVTLGILIYGVAADGSPGNAISENEVQFIVKADHRGELEVNLEELNLPSQEMFIGVSVLSDISDTENNIYIRFNESDQTRAYAVFDSTDEKLKNQWMGFLNYYFKMKIKIEQEK